MQLIPITHFDHFVSERFTASPPENSGNLMFLTKCQNITAIGVNHQKKREFRARQLRM